MLLGKIFDRFANGSPVTVMPRGTLEYALRPELLDQLFQETARRPYAHKLLVTVQSAGRSEGALRPLRWATSAS